MLLVVLGGCFFARRCLLQVLRQFCRILSRPGFLSTLLGQRSTAGFLQPQQDGFCLCPLHHRPGKEKVSSGTAWQGVAHSIPSVGLACSGSNICWHSLWIRGGKCPLAADPSCLVLRGAGSSLHAVVELPAPESHSSGSPCFSLLGSGLV